MARGRGELPTFRFRGELRQYRASDWRKPTGRRSLAARLSRHSQGGAACGRFTSLDTVATAQGTAAIEEDGRAPGHGRQPRPPASRKLCAPASLRATGSPQLRSLICARICAQDAAGRGETRETPHAVTNEPRPATESAPPLETGRGARDARRTAHNPATIGNTSMHQCGQKNCSAAHYEWHAPEPHTR